MVLIIFITHLYGNATGRYEVVYGNPQSGLANNSAARGEIQSRQSGVGETYDNMILQYKPKMKLLSSKKTFAAFKEYYEYIASRISERDKYIAKENPLEDISRCHTTYDSETGQSGEVWDVSQGEIEFFEDSLKIYKCENAPDIEEINKYVEPLYQAMRKDLGSKQ